MKYRDWKYRGWKYQRGQWPRISYLRIGLFLATLLFVLVLSPAIAVEPPSIATTPPVDQSIGQIPGHMAPEDATELLHQGQRFYEAGQLANAVEVWETAAQIAHQGNDSERYILSLNALAMAYQDLGLWESADQAIHQSLDRLNTLGASPQLDQSSLGKRLYAQALNILGELQLAMGHPHEAIDTWQQAGAAYQQHQDTFGMIGSQMNQAQALQMLGHYRQAQSLLEEISVELQGQSASSLKALNLMSLGSVLQVTGNLNNARDLLTQGIALAQSFYLDDEVSSALLRLGHIYRVLGNREQAYEFYQSAVDATSNPIRELDAYLSQLNLAVKDSQWQSAHALLPLIQNRLEHLTPSRMGVYAHVNFAVALRRASRGTPSIYDADRRRHKPSMQLASSLEIAQLLRHAVQQARQLNDQQAESYALGELGQLYEASEQYDWATELTQHALVLSQLVNAPEIIYRWQWQLGRIQVKQATMSSAQHPSILGNSTLSGSGSAEAIAFYTDAVNTLKSVSRELLATNPEFQFSFRETVEPVYRELADLLLQTGATSDDLRQARDVLEDLQRAELENFFRSACLDVNIKQIDDIDPAAAVIYPLILPDRLEVILSVPGGSLQQYTTPLSKIDIEETLEQLLQSLNPAFSDRTRLALSQRVYGWLIHPIESALREHHIETLVFVPDGFLRNIPMAALHDGEHYLIETYAVALAPGLQLITSQTGKSSDIRILTAGISEARQGFSALPGVEAELNEISRTFPSDTFLNQDFTKEKLHLQLAETTFSIVHLATHGQFSSDPEQTFLLSWDDQINLKEFETLVHTRHAETSHPIELLVLSACQTAVGDNQAALGLAGFAVRAGARSTLATLWSVNDESTALLMTRFYQLLKNQPEASKSALLKQAQLSMLKQGDYRHPFYWAPFVLVGNWL